MSSTATARLRKERTKWRRNQPNGFVARPSQNEDGSLNLMIWDCVIPGLKNTNWENGLYPLKMIFKDDYPSTPPICQFIQPLFHPNIFNSGTVCMSILDEDKDWKPSLSIHFILKSIQILLAKPEY